jgi:hypothetical protein
MPSRAEIARAFHGAWRLALLDRGAMSYFDLSHRGVWRSFWAAAICYPGFFILLFLRVNADAIARSGIAQITLVETIGYITAWCAFPLLVLTFTRRIGREDEGFNFIVAYNWSQMLQTAVFVMVAFINLVMISPSEQPSADLITPVAVIAVLAYEWFIALIAIGAGGWIALVIVISDVVIGAAVQTITATLY